MKLSVICPTYRNAKYLDLFLRSAVEGKKLDTTEIIVAVDGYYNESADVLKKHEKDIQILDLGQNRGMQTAINLAVYQTQGNTNLLIVNDDNILDDGYDEHLSKLSLLNKFVYTIEQVEPQAGMFDFIVQNFGRTAETFDYTEFQEFAKKNRSKLITNAGRIFPYLISKKNFMLVNGFDTLYDSPNLCDWDHFLKLELAGLKFVRIRDSIFYHFGSIATKVNNESSVFRLKEQRAAKTFRYKWNFDPYNGLDNIKIPPNSWLVKD